MTEGVIDGLTVGVSEWLGPVVLDFEVVGGGVVDEWEVVSVDFVWLVDML